MDTEAATPVAPVGVCVLGASAGGLEPLAELLGAIPPSLGAAFVVVQHLSPDHESVMVKILERRTTMPVLSLTDGQELEPNKVYVLGPGEEVTLDKRRVSIVARSHTGADSFHHRPIDNCFTSLASWEARGVAVVLSGTGHDGTEGTARVRAAGGLVLAQNESAQFGDMPDSVARSGNVDAVGPPQELAAIVTRYFRTGARPAADPDQLNPIEVEILLELETATGINFDDYKRGTVRRRLEHRLRAVGASNQEGLLDKIRRDPTEADATTQDILIGVTKFFRDQNTFDELARRLLPGLVEHAAEHERPIRLWSVGCATGQEAYSLAMTLVETRDQINPSTPIKVFATDVHDGSLAVASKGWYPETQMDTINPERRERFFLPEGGGWRARPELRGMLAFSRHNVLTNPPFTRIDLLACRNALIYLSGAAQRDAFWAFGFALRVGGVLMLGESESVGPAAPDYDRVAPSLYRMTSNRTSLTLRRGRRVSDALFPQVPATPIRRAASISTSSALETQGHDQILAAHGIGAIEVDESHRLVRIYGLAADWLEFSAGAPPQEAIGLVRHVGLRAAISGVLRQLASGAATPRETTVIESEEGPRFLTIAGTRSTSKGTGTYLIHGRVHDESADDDGDDPAQVGEELNVDLLDRELQATQRHLDAVNAQLEESVRRQEESEQQLTATNEELLVSNEELQTSIEELSSTNEELRTVAEENEVRLRDVVMLTADLDQVLNATDVGVLLLDEDHTIRRFSGTCDEYFNVLDSDIGRPFNHVRANFDDAELRQAVDRAARSGETARLRVERTPDFPRVLQVTVLPYEVIEDRWGVSIALIDVTAVTEREVELEQLSSRFAETLSEASVALWECTPDGDPLWVSDNFVDVAGFSIDAWRDFPALDVIHPDDVERLTATADQLQVPDWATEPPPPIEIDYRVGSADGAYRSVNVRYRGFPRDGKMVVRGLSTDVTTAREQTRLLEALNRDLSDFTDLASHDLRSPLRGIRSLVGFIEEDSGDDLPGETAEMLAELDAKVEAMQRLLDDLLEYARSTKSKEQVEPVDLGELIDELRSTVVTTDRIDLVSQVDIQPVVTSRALLGTCLRNIVDNAVKHHPGPTGTVTVRAQVTRNLLIVTVADDGAGIDPAHQERIFRPFQSMGKDGSGIGLAAVHKIVHERGGTIELRSEVGRGSAFTITWPLHGPRPSTNRFDDRHDTRLGGDVDGAHLDPSEVVRAT